MNLEEIDKNYVLNTYKREYINFIRGVGATLYDKDNKTYIDFSSGIGVVSLGHSNKRLVSVISKQVSNIIHCSNLYLIEPQALLAKKINDLYGQDIAMFFSNSGAEANECAIKMARKYGEKDGSCKRYKIITLRNSFHGRTITSLKATGQEAMHNYFGPYPDGFVYANNIANVKDIIDDQTVAVMLELIQGEGGVEAFDIKELQNLEKLLKKKDILLIIDEVQTGVYRTGEFLASNYYNISPDIITMAKGLANGIPIGVTASRIKNIFSFGDHGSTFGGNFLSSRAALEVLDILSTKKEEININIRYFDFKLNEFFKNFEDIFSKKLGIGFMRGLRVKDLDLGLIIKLAIKEGVLVLKAGKNTLRFLPPILISKDEIDEGFLRLNKALKNI